MIPKRRPHRAASVLAVAACAAFFGGLAARGPLGPVSLSAASPSAAVRRLQQDIDTLLAAPTLQSGIWGVMVKSLARDETLYAVNARKLLVPSSNMKILTLAAAAERLGWDYAYETRITAVGQIDSGVLHGDLMIVGTGDPSIDNWNGAASRLFKQWADELKAAGVHAITGRLIGDDNSFDDEALGAGWAWDDLDRSYATGVGALQFNENTAQITVRPGAAVGDRATITSAPPGADLVVRNLVTTGARDTPSTLTSERLPGSTMLAVRGSIALTARPLVRNVSVVNPTLYFVNELRDALIGNGIEVRGAAVDIDDLVDPPSRDHGSTLLTYRSPPLSDLATTMMKLSQNLYAETLLKTLGLSAGTPSAAGGTAAVRAVMDLWGVPALGYVQADGSGLSRYNYATPETLVDVLAHIDRDRRLRDPFRASLPVAGRDGTLENRMRGTAAEGNARAKTGSLTNARAISGYVSSAEGEALVFSILGNNFGVPGELVDKAADAVVVRLARFSRK
jgi:D-alanyl-D-alanine carboxypeptidase/D-alanyl-D-alanine-endopeptidase (penicillin-binding protein 4)